MVSIPTLNKFRTSLTKGVDYTNPGNPEPIQLIVSDKGMTSRETEVHIQKCANIGNEWRALSAEADVHKEKSIAHQKTYEAMTAEISAGTAYLNSQGAWYNYKGTEARVKIAEGEMNLAIASVPIQVARQNLELEKLKLQLEQTALETNKLRDDVAHIRVMNALNGYNIDVALPPGLASEVFMSSMQAEVEMQPSSNTTTSPTSAVSEMLRNAKDWMSSIGDEETEGSEPK